MLLGLVAFTPLYGLVVVDLMNIPLDVAAEARVTLQILSFWSFPVAWRRAHQGVLIRIGLIHNITAFIHFLLIRQFLFAADLLRMYQRYADARGWRFETIEEQTTEIGGIKEVIALDPGRIEDRLALEPGQGAARLFVGDLTRSMIGGGFRAPTTGTPA